MGGGMSRRRRWGHEPKMQIGQVARRRRDLHSPLSTLTSKNTTFVVLREANLRRIFAVDLKNKTGMTDTGTYYLPFGKHNSLTPLQDVVTPLRASVTPLQDVVISLRGAVTPLQDVVTSLRGVETPLRGAVTSLKDAVTPLRGAVTSPENTDILAIIPKNRIL